MMRRLHVIVISRDFGELEERLLKKNVKRARDVFGEIKVAYVLGSDVNVRTCLRTDPAVRVFLIRNPVKQRNAALSRAVGFQALGIVADDVVLFLDGDMLVSRAYLSFLRELDEPTFISLSHRVDVWNMAGHLRRRLLRFDRSQSGRFNKLYGCMAMRGVDFNRLNVMTHDMEEQWLLRGLNLTSVQHVLFPHFGVFHFDRFVGIDRKLRFLTTSRGVGVWQGLFRDASVSRMIADLIFMLRQKDGWLDVLKFLAVAAVSLPKMLLYRMPRHLCFQEIKDVGQ
jgi:hypothetical protein